ENQTKNIVLIGMPGCGKSKVGAILAELTGKQFVDADKYLQEKTGMFAGDMIKEKGEEYFRQQESMVLEELGKRSGLIIATGGGCVTREENYAHLHRNGTIFWRQRDIEKLPTEGRPLSQQGSLQEMYKKRAPLYERFADVIISNDGDDPHRAAEKILEAME
ncbi:MAG: shikimate kinase, partial [Oscillospiraceae bacterium]|nr:shikimate kinase [Oscillospiraceae bacterium]